MIALGLMAALLTPAQAPPASGEAPWVTMVVTSRDKQTRSFISDLSRATGAALTHAGITFVPPPERALSEVQLALGCAQLDEKCAASMGESMGAATVAVVVLERTPAPGVTYSLIDVASAERLSVRAVAIARFDTIGAQQVAAALAGDLGVPGRLTIRSQPPGAAVLVDGTVVGQTPVTLAGTLAEGPHDVSVRFSDGEQIDQRVVVRRGEETLVELARAANVDDGPGVIAVLGWSLVGASAVAALTGGLLGGLAALDKGRYDESQVVDGEQVQLVDREEARALSDGIDAYVTGAQVAFGASLVLALGGAAAFAFGEE